MTVAGCQVILWSSRWRFASPIPMVASAFAGNLAPPASCGGPRGFPFQTQNGCSGVNPATPPPAWVTQPCSSADQPPDANITLPLPGDGSTDPFGFLPGGDARRPPHGETTFLQPVGPRPNRFDFVTRNCNRFNNPNPNCLAHCDKFGSLHGSSNRKADNR